MVSYFTFIQKVQSRFMDIHSLWLSLFPRASPLNEGGNYGFLLVGLCQRMDTIVEFLDIEQAG